MNDQPKDLFEEALEAKVAEIKDGIEAAFRKGLATAWAQGREAGLQEHANEWSWLTGYRRERPPRPVNPYADTSDTETSTTG